MDRTETSGPAADLVASVLAVHCPDSPLKSLEKLGQGQQNTAWLVNGELVVRFGRETDAQARADMIVREAAVIDTVAPVCSLPIPVLEFSDPARGCLGYRKLPGVPLSTVPPPPDSAEAVAIAGHLGTFLAGLHRSSRQLWSELVETDDQPMSEWRSDAADSYDEAAGTVPEQWRPTIETFLTAPPPERGTQLVFSHNDLGIEHVLVDPVRKDITGIIDWTDAALVDPAYDFGLLLRDLGAAALETALRQYGKFSTIAPGFVERAMFYARCSALEDLAYGHTQDAALYLSRASAALKWLFAR